MDLLSLQLSREVGDLGAEADSIAWLAELLLAMGKDALAAQLFGAAESFRQTKLLRQNSHMGRIHTRSIDVLKERMDASSFAAAWADGLRLTLDQALRYALEVLRG